MTGHEFDTLAQARRVTRPTAARRHNQEADLPGGRDAVRIARLRERCPVPRSDALRVFHRPFAAGRSATSPVWRDSSGSPASQCPDQNGRNRSRTPRLSRYNRNGFALCDAAIRPQRKRWPVPLPVRSAASAIPCSSTIDGPRHADRGDRRHPSAVPQVLRVRARPRPRSPAYNPCATVCIICSSPWTSSARIARSHGRRSHPSRALSSSTVPSLPTRSPPFQRTVRSSAIGVQARTKSDCWRMWRTRQHTSSSTP